MPEQEFLVLEIPLLIRIIVPLRSGPIPRAPTVSEAFLDFVLHAELIDTDQLRLSNSFTSLTLQKFGSFANETSIVLGVCFLELVHP